VTADVVICGAGIAGIAAAYYLAVTHGLENVMLVDERPPLSLTSDKSTECYRNWWPGPGDAMVSLMNRSIDIIEEFAHETGNAFHLNRRGYLFVTADPARIPVFRRAAEEAAELGVGPARYHTGQPHEQAYAPAPAHGFEDQPTGANVILDPALIQQHFPYLISADPFFPEIVLRGLATAIPGLEAYFDRMPKLVLDGGYYTKTQENRPLVGPMPVEGAYVIGALSGFGLTASPASGELLAAHITGGELPHYAPAFALARYEDLKYWKLLKNWKASGQI
jgi:glycine/D-amino acid oxidase-like deaminating enzyme